MPDTPLSKQPSIPNYRISFEPNPRRVWVVFNGVTVADSRQTIILHETRCAPTYYFPRAHVNFDLLEQTEHHSHCPFRGNATYWNLNVDGKVEENAVWSYQDPFHEALIIKDYLAFYQDRMDAVYEADEAVTVSTQPESVLDTNPLAGWLLREAWKASSTQELVGWLCHYLRKIGIPLWRFRLIIRTLHPQLFSNSYGWQYPGDVEEFDITYSILQESRYLDSPLVPIFAGAGGVRRRLDIPNLQLDYPILQELKAEGATDYAAMPMTFSDGQINVITLASKQAGGFSTTALGYIYETLPLLSRLVEVHALRRTAVHLLDTYLGRHSGEKVLNGLVKRGDGESIHAVLWFCDLRESTSLADSMSQDDFLRLLNHYFECMAGAVLDHGGEVLRFIGDAVLAIFPILNTTDEDRRALTVKACEAALTAVNDAGERMDKLNEERRLRAESPLQTGIGLHLGDVMYGNIGTAQRLEFTVIGAAANEAARIESLCKTLNKPVLISAEFARYSVQALVSLGRYCLRGVHSEQEIFTLANHAFSKSDQRETAQ